MSDLPNIVQVTDSTFTDEVLNHEGYILVDFWAEWCHPCKLLEPEIEKIAKQAPGLRVAKLNVDENPETAGMFQVLSIPTMLLVTPDRNDQGKRRSVFTMGFRPYPQLKSWLKDAGFDLDNQPQAAETSAQGAEQAQEAEAESTDNSEPQAA